MKEKLVRVLSAVALAATLTVALVSSVFAAAPDYTSDITSLATENILTPLPAILLVIGGIGLAVIFLFKGLSLVFHGARKTPTR